MVARYWLGLMMVLASLCLARVGTLAATGGRLFAVQLVARGADTSVTLGLIRPLAFRAAIDPASGRLIVDFPQFPMMPGSSIGRGTGLVRAFHAEPINGGVRVVFDLTGPASIVASRAVPAENGRGPGIVIDLKPAAPSARVAATAPVPTRSLRVAPSIAALIPPLNDNPTSAAPPARAVLPVRAPLVESQTARRGVVLSSRRVIVVDAGHGGIDPGAPSVAGYHEKEVTLATARALRRVLEETGRYKVVLTRDGDVFLKLHERVALARAQHGNLFISLHADSVADAGTRSALERGARGASIYTLSETASDAESERYAQRENRADAIGGVSLADQSDDVAGILVDLTVRETVNQGNRLAVLMADALEHDGITLLPRAPHRAAGFAVLKSPDIPSILIEMGYLSDPSDARALADPRHQLQLAKAIAEGVDHYFAWLDTSRS